MRESWTNGWNSPFHGLGYFLTRPRLWGWALLAIALFAGLTVAVCAKTIAATYPAVFSFWAAMQSIGWGLFAFVLMILFVFPALFNALFGRALAKQGRREGDKIAEEPFLDALISSAAVFVRTLKWRLLWPLLLLVSIVWIPFLVFPLSLIAANHLAVLESADLALSLFGVSVEGRVRWIRGRGRDCLAAALSGALLAFLLSFLVIGWIFWIPAIYCGTFLWVRRGFRK